ncbi:hypothetical protein VM95_04915 [Streptomyces rubellomurinus]|uniref:Uncharacterized protein n=2 Tax=Streptomyces TaxID=1883 RepID=A0A0F2TLB0_STRR3|nr:hypothetical protein VM95_04915 [Streptomyces rubellomurinus]
MLINLVQVGTGRQLVRPSESRRTPVEVRQQSAAAAVEMLGGVLIGLEMFWGIAVVLLGFVALVLLRKRAAYHY